MLKIFLILTTLFSLNLFADIKIICESDEGNTVEITNTESINIDSININGSQYDILSPTLKSLSFNVGFGVPAVTVFKSDIRDQIATIIFHNTDIDSNRRGFEGLEMMILLEGQKPIEAECTLSN
ncbi:hypothetical protein N9N67_10420 [Bacteriovoracaceae bacterium]|nr:hypothetical protein [Bacteriovoracaceae bacterium]